MDLALTVLFHIALPFIGGFLTCAIVWLEVARRDRERAAAAKPVPVSDTVVPYRDVEVPRGGSWAKPGPRRYALKTMSDMWKPQPE